jgi:hypothetical protein
MTSASGQPGGALALGSRNGRRPTGHVYGVQLALRGRHPHAGHH